MNKNTLNWRFDVNTFRLIGRDLITDRITAVFELVKNMYDANAQNAWVKFENIHSKINAKIILKDDGLGMSFEDIRDKWMVIGTNSKRKQSHSPAPYNRRYVGEKGIGRFAVDKLGGKVTIRTKKAGETQWLNVELNWENYEQLAKEQSLTLFTEVDNNFFYEDAPSQEEHGTELIITGIREEWTKNDLERLSKELTKIVSPFHKLNPPFDIFVKSNEHPDFGGKEPVKTDIVSFYSHKAEITFFEDKNNPENSYQEIIKFDKEKGEIYTEKKPLEIFGGVKMKIYFFDEEAKNKFNKFSKSDDTKIDGIKIYRDGLVTTPFAELNADRNKQKDILGIDKRLWRDIFNRISTREIIGILDITQEGNPKITDTTNRQDFVDNTEYRRLKDFIIEQLDVFSEIKIYKREQKKRQVDSLLEKVKEDTKDFEKTIKNIQVKLDKVEPELKNEIESLKKQSAELENALKKGIEQQKKERKEFLRKENIYLSLVSSQTFAGELAHTVRQSLGNVKDMIEFFKNRYPNPKYEDIFKQYVFLAYEELEKLNKIVDFMLGFAAANEESLGDFSLKEVIENLLQRVYFLSFEKEQISIFTELENYTLFGNKRFFEDIIQQLISNSIKFLKETSEKKIRCTGYIENNHYILLFSDNGVGIPKENREKVFEMYFTTSSEQGGAGIGLWVAKLRAEVFRGTIEVIDSELAQGATFKIMLPLKKS